MKKDDIYLIELLSKSRQNTYVARSLKEIAERLKDKTIIEELNKSIERSEQQTEKLQNMIFYNENLNREN